MKTFDNCPECNQPPLVNQCAVEGYKTRFIIECTNKDCKFFELLVRDDKWGSEQHKNYNQQQASEER